MLTRRHSDFGKANLLVGLATVLIFSGLRNGVDNEEKESMETEQ